MNKLKTIVLTSTLSSLLAASASHAEVEVPERVQRATDEQALSIRTQVNNGELDINCGSAAIQVVKRGNSVAEEIPTEDIPATLTQATTLSAEKNKLVENCMTSEVIDSAVRAVTGPSGGGGALAAGAVAVGLGAVALASSDSKTTEPKSTPDSQ